MRNHKYLSIMLLWETEWGHSKGEICMAEQNMPVIFVVDNDPATLETVHKNLERQYRERYRVVAVHSTTEAQSELEHTRQHETPVALIIVGCELDGRSGIELVEQASKLFPDAKRVLLAEYDEKPNVTAAINRHELDSYLLVPFQSIEDDLLAPLEDLLQDWQSSVSLSGNGIYIVGYQWSSRAHEVKNFLARNLIPYRWLEIEQSQEARSLLEREDLDHRHLPVVFFPDGKHMARPSIEELASRVGLRQQAESRFYDLVVVGGGPAGLSAAVYGASEGLDTLLIEKEAPGGQAGQSSRIDNYLGFPSGLSGSELTRRAVAQASRFGVEILTPQEATGVRLHRNYRLVQLADGSEVACFVVLIATGVSYRRLEVPGEERLTGSGVFYGTVITEAITCTGKDVFILGSGNSAGQAAMYLSRFAGHITMLTDQETLGATMSHYLVNQIEETENINARFQCTVTEVHGQDHVEALTIRDLVTGNSETLPAAALFVYIGAYPHTDWLGDLVARDPQGYILTGPDLDKAVQNEQYAALNREPLFLESSIPGIFSAGDTRRGSVKRIASSVGEGAMAVTLIHQYLSTL
jgi:thioredoxin reductase (NADPH)